MSKLSPHSNMIWSSSRWILPEHRELILKYQELSQHKERPELEEDELIKIQYVIGKSINNKTEIMLKVFGEIEDRECRGYVVRADMNSGQILFQTIDGDEWIPIRDIISATE